MTTLNFLVHKSNNASFIQNYAVSWIHQHLFTAFWELTTRGQYKSQTRVEFIVGFFCCCCCCSMENGIHKEELIIRLNGEINSSYGIGSEKKRRHWPGGISGLFFFPFHYDPKLEVKVWGLKMSVWHLFRTAHCESIVTTRTSGARPKCRHHDNKILKSHLQFTDNNMTDYSKSTKASEKQEHWITINTDTFTDYTFARRALWAELFEMIQKKKKSVHLWTS